MNTVRVFPEPARKTVAIFTAPVSLLVVGYFNSFITPATASYTPILMYVLLAGALICYLYVGVMILVELRKIDFYPTYAAFTFPIVISAMAFRIGANFLTMHHGWAFLVPIATGTLWIAIFAVAFVIRHYFKYFRFWLKF